LEVFGTRGQLGADRARTRTQNLRHVPPQHKLFVALVLIQAALVVGQRVWVISQTVDAIASARAQGLDSAVNQLERVRQEQVALRAPSKHAHMHTRFVARWQWPPRAITQIWFFCMLTANVGFMVYFAFHAILHANVCMCGCICGGVCMRV
jgi:hypothetical protein